MAEVKVEEGGRTKYKALVRWLGASVYESFGVPAAKRDEILTEDNTARLATVLATHRLSPTRNDRRFPNQNQASNCWWVGRSLARRVGGRWGGIGALPRHCFLTYTLVAIPPRGFGRTAFNEYQLCADKRGKTDTVCLQRGRDYLSVCPEKWVSPSSQLDWPRPRPPERKPTFLASLRRRLRLGRSTRRPASPCPSARASSSKQPSERR